MNLYFGKLSDENKIILDNDESIHLISVHRAKIGETIQVTDGEGNLFIATVERIDKKNCSLLIQEKIISERKPYRLHIALAPTKNIDRMEWFLEKATETGIDEISFLICRHSERREIKTDRLNRILISALKQSQKSFLPQLNPVEDFKTFITKTRNEIKLICTMNAEKSNSLKTKYKPGQSLLALIGPEGDFNPEELDLALKNNYQLISLGNSRLRTETAALNVCTIFNFINS
jgi:16S rRNA (uracil1498-N3)-methyltransferase